MSAHHRGPGIVVIGGSAGSIRPLCTLLASLPASFGAPLAVVVHVPPAGISVMPTILARAGNLPAQHVEGPTRLDAGRVYVAPPNRHLVVVRGGLDLSAEPRLRGHRPSIDITFRSAARVHGPRCIGVVLSGMLEDGADGLGAIERAGGRCIVQSPESSAFDSMPSSALRLTRSARVLPPEDIGEALVAMLADRLRVREGSAGAPA